MHIGQLYQKTEYNEKTKRKETNIWVVSEKDNANFILTLTKVGSINRSTYQKLLFLFKDDVELQDKIQAFFKEVSADHDLLGILSDEPDNVTLTAFELANEDSTFKTFNHFLVN